MKVFSYFLDKVIVVFIVTLLAALVAFQYEKKVEEEDHQRALQDQIKTDLFRLASLATNANRIESDFTGWLSKYELKAYPNLIDTPTQWGTFSFRQNYNPYSSLVPIDTTSFLVLLSLLDESIDGLNRSLERVQRLNDHWPESTQSDSSKYANYARACKNVVGYAIFTKDYAANWAAVAELEHGVSIRGTAPNVYDYNINPRYLQDNLYSFKVNGISLDSLKKHDRAIVKHVMSRIPKVELIK